MTGDDAVQARFLSVLSHDLRGALNTVQLSLEMLRRDIRATAGSPGAAGGGAAADAGQMHEDLDLGRRALVEATVRLERLVISERLRRGVMPVRVSNGDVIAAVRQAIEQSAVAAAASDDLGQVPSIALDLPATWVVRTDPRLLAEMIGGLVDHALRRTRGEGARVGLDPDARTFTVSADQDWVQPDDEAMLRPGATISAFDPQTVSLYVAGRCAQLLGIALNVRPRDVAAALPT